LPGGVSAAQVAEVLQRAVGPLLERLEVFDEYRGPGIPAGQRGVAWHCSLRDPARTLREAEVDAALTRGLAALEDELGVRRREGCWTGARPARDDPPARSGGAHGLAYARPQTRSRIEGERRTGRRGQRQVGPRRARP